MGHRLGFVTKFTKLLGKLRELVGDLCRELVAPFGWLERFGTIERVFEQSPLLGDQKVVER